MKTFYFEMPRFTWEELEVIESEFLVENDSLALIVETSNHNKAHFFYRVNDDLSFNFSLLCEVGKFYQPGFERILRKNRLRLEIRETENDYYNVVLPMPQKRKAQ